MGDVVDALSLYALVAGVAASLGAGVMTIAGGLEALFSLPDTVMMTKHAIALLIVIAFILSSISGLQRGIRILSDINVRIFMVIALFIFAFGPTLTIIREGGLALGQYVMDFLPASLTLGERANDPWTRDWTIYFFANWLAWAPVTALFLGRIAVGYTVREFLLFNLVLPALVQRGVDEHSGGQRH